MYPRDKTEHARRKRCAEIALTESIMNGHSVTGDTDSIADATIRVSSDFYPHPLTHGEEVCEFYYRTWQLINQSEDEFMNT